MSEWCNKWIICWVNNVIGWQDKLTISDMKEDL